MGISTIALFGNTTDRSDNSDNLLNSIVNSKVNQVIKESPATTEDDKVKNHIDFSLITQEDIYNKMLNTVDYFESVSGSYEYINKQVGTKPLIAEYKVRLKNNPASYERIVDINNAVREAIGDSTNTYEFDKEYNTYQVRTSNFNAASSAITNPKDRIKVNSNGEKVYYYRIDVTNTSMVRASIFPQEMAFGFLSDFSTWKIDGVEKYLDYSAVLVTGRLSGDYAKKLNVYDYKLWIEPSTGILLKWEGFDTNNNISRSLITTKFKLNADEKIKQISEVDLSKYTKIEDPFLKK